MRRLIYFSVGFLILALYVWKLNIFSVVKELKTSFDYSIFWIVIPLVLLTTVIRALRWRYISGKLTAMRLSFWQAIKLTSISFFIALVTPAKIGDFSRSLFYRENRAALTGALSIEFFFDLVLLFLIPSILLPIKAPFFLLIPTIVCGIFIALYILTKLNLSLFSKIIGRIFLGKKKPNSESIQKIFTATVKKGFKTPGVLVVCFLASTILYLNYYFCTFLIFRALAIKLDLLTTITGLSVSQAIGTVSTIPMGLGIREVTAITFFNYDRTLLLSGLLVSRLLMLLPFFMGFYFYLMYPKNSILFDFSKKR